MSMAVSFAHMCAYYVGAWYLKIREKIRSVVVAKNQRIRVLCENHNASGSLPNALTL